MGVKVRPAHWVVILLAFIMPSPQTDAIFVPLVKTVFSPVVKGVQRILPLQGFDKFSAAMNTVEVSYTFASKESVREALENARQASVTPYKGTAEKLQGQVSTLQKDLTQKSKDLNIQMSKSESLLDVHGGTGEDLFVSPDHLNMDDVRSVFSLVQQYILPFCGNEKEALTGEISYILYRSTIPKSLLEYGPRNQTRISIDAFSGNLSLISPEVVMTMKRYGRFIPTDRYYSMQEIIQAMDYTINPRALAMNQIREKFMLGNWILDKSEQVYYTSPKMAIRGRCAPLLSNRILSRRRRMVRGIPYLNTFMTRALRNSKARTYPRTSGPRSLSTHNTVPLRKGSITHNRQSRVSNGYYTGTRVTPKDGLTMTWKERSKVCEGVPDGSLAPFHMQDGWKVGKIPKTKGKTRVIPSDPPEPGTILTLKTLKDYESMSADDLNLVDPDRTTYVVYKKSTDLSSDRPRGLRSQNRPYDFGPSIRGEKNGPNDFQADYSKADYRLTYPDANPSPYPSISTDDSVFMQNSKSLKHKETILAAKQRAGVHDHIYGWRLKNGERVEARLENPQGAKQVSASSRAQPSEPVIQGQGAGASGTGIGTYAEVFPDAIYKSKVNLDDLSEPTSWSFRSMAKNLETGEPGKRYGEALQLQHARRNLRKELPKPGNQAETDYRTKIGVAKETQLEAHAGKLAAAQEFERVSGKRTYSEVVKDQSVEDQGQYVQAVKNLKPGDTWRYDSGDSGSGLRITKMRKSPNKLEKSAADNSEFIDRQYQREYRDIPAAREALQRMEVQKTFHDEISSHLTNPKFAGKIDQSALKTIHEWGTYSRKDKAIRDIFPGETSAVGILESVPTFSKQGLLRGIKPADAPVTTLNQALATKPNYKPGFVEQKAIDAGLIYDRSKGAQNDWISIIKRKHGENKNIKTLPADKIERLRLRPGNARETSKAEASQMMRDAPYETIAPDDPIIDSISRGQTPNVGRALYRDVMNPLEDGVSVGTLANRNFAGKWFDKAKAKAKDINWGSKTMKIVGTLTMFTGMNVPLVALQTWMAQAMMPDTSVEQEIKTAQQFFFNQQLAAEHNKQDEQRMFALVNREEFNLDRLLDSMDRLDDGESIIQLLKNSKLIDDEADWKGRSEMNKHQGRLLINRQKHKNRMEFERLKDRLENNLVNLDKELDQIDFALLPKPKLGSPDVRTLVKVTPNKKGHNIFNWLNNPKENINRQDIMTIIENDDISEEVRMDAKRHLKTLINHEDPNNWGTIINKNSKFLGRTSFDSPWNKLELSIQEDAVRHPLEMTKVLQKGVVAIRKMLKDNPGMVPVSSDGTFSWSHPAVANLDPDQFNDILRAFVVSLKMTDHDRKMGLMHTMMYDRARIGGQTLRDQILNDFESITYDVNGEEAFGVGRKRPSQVVPHPEGNNVGNPPLIYGENSFSTHGEHIQERPSPVRKTALPPMTINPMLRESDLNIEVAGGTHGAIGGRSGSEFNQDSSLDMSFIPHDHNSEAGSTFHSAVSSRASHHNPMANYFNEPVQQVNSRIISTPTDLGMLEFNHRSPYPNGATAYNWNQIYNAMHNPDYHEIDSRRRFYPQMIQRQVYHPLPVRQQHTQPSPPVYERPVDQYHVQSSDTGYVPQRSNYPRTTPPSTATTPPSTIGGTVRNPNRGRQNSRSNLPTVNDFIQDRLNQFRPSAPRIESERPSAPRVEGERPVPMPRRSQGEDWIPLTRLTAPGSAVSGRPGIRGRGSGDPDDPGDPNPGGSGLVLSDTSDSDRPPGYDGLPRSLQLARTANNAAANTNRQAAMFQSIARAMTFASNQVQAFRNYMAANPKYAAASSFAIGIASATGLASTIFGIALSTMNKTVQLAEPELRSLEDIVNNILYQDLSDDEIAGLINDSLNVMWTALKQTDYWSNKNELKSDLIKGGESFMEKLLRSYETDVSSSPVTRPESFDLEMLKTKEGRDRARAMWSYFKNLESDRIIDSVPNYGNTPNPHMGKRRRRDTETRKIPAQISPDVAAFQLGMAQRGNGNDRLTNLVSAEYIKYLNDRTEQFTGFLHNKTEEAKFLDELRKNRTTNALKALGLRYNSKGKIEQEVPLIASSQDKAQNGLLRNITSKMFDIELDIVGNTGKINNLYKIINSYAEDYMGWQDFTLKVNTITQQHLQYQADRMTKVIRRIEQILRKKIE